MKQNESMKLKETVKRAKQELTDHHQIHDSPSSLDLFATKSSELKLT